MIVELRAAFGGFRRFAGLFFTYLVVTQAVLWLLLYPAFWWLARHLFRWGGVITLNSANAGSFLVSWPGLLFALLAILVLLTTVLLEGGGFIKLSAVVIRSGSKPSFLSVVRDIARSLRAIIGPGFVVVVLLVLVVFPLTGSAMNAGVLLGLRIPNFVMSVIQASPGLSLAYGGLMLVCHVCMFFMSFLFQFMLLGHHRFASAARASFRLVTANAWRFLAFMGIWTLVLVLALVVALGIGIAAVSLVAAIVEPSWLRTFLGSALVFLLVGIGVLGGVLLVPLQLHLITTRYYAYLAALSADDPLHADAQEFPELPGKTKPSLLDRLLGCRALVAGVLVAGVVGSAGMFTVFAEDLTQAPDIAVVGHRGGPGDDAIENTIEAVELSIAAGAEYVEVDVQRTKDGHYVVFHDTTFERFTSEKRPVQDLTLAEIQALDLGEKSNGRHRDVRVPTLEQMIAAVKGRIGLFLELKGPTADRHMVDDAVAALRRAGVLDSTVVMSLDYRLIEYVEQTQPEVVSGFTYVRSLGDTPQLTGDFLILEEDAASRQLLDDLHAVGKRAAIWTVNEEDSMYRFVNWDVDAIITDYVPRWQEVAQQRREDQPLDVLINTLLD